MDDKVEDPLINYLMKKKIILTKIYTPFDLINTLEYQLIKILNIKNALSIKDIMSNFDIEKLISSQLNKLESRELIKRDEEGNWILSKETKKGIVEVKSNDQDQISEIKDEEKEEKVDIEKLLGEIEIDKPSKIKTKIRAELMDKSGEKEKEEPDIATSDIEDLFDDVLEEPMEEFLEDFAVVEVVQSDTGKPILGGPIIDILRNQGYIKSDLAKEEELMEVPEYEILSIIVKGYPITLEKIEENAKTSSVSMVLSNLKADDLIEQTNDYRWTISKKVAENLKEYISSKMDATRKKKDAEGLKSLIEQDSDGEKQFFDALISLEYIIEETTLEQALEMPDIAILKIIRDKESVSMDDIKELAEGIPRVQVTRMISKLEADDRITNFDGKWELSQNFIKILVGLDI